MTTPAILLIDDDPGLCALMAEYLGGRGYAVSCAQDGATGLHQAMTSPPALVILDAMLPRMDGFEVLRQLRQRSPVPIIMLTARAAEEDRISGLESGADDYLLKPFAAGELVARIRAVLRRTQARAPNRSPIVEVGGVRLNAQTYEVWAGGVRIAITPTEFEILERLMRSAGQVVSRDEIAGMLYQREATMYERSVDVHVSHLRRKLERHVNAPIRTVRGVGYLFPVAA